MDVSQNQLRHECGDFRDIFVSVMRLKRGNLLSCASQMELIYCLGAVVNIVTTNLISLIDDVSRNRFHNIVLLA